MSEMITTYMLTDPEKAIPMDRGDFYSEQIDAYHKTGKPTRAADIIDIFIFNSDNELMIQKRSYNKAHNPGMLDKSIGGHVRWDDTVDYTVMVETVQELQTPSIVLRDRKDFQKTYGVLKSYLDTIALVQYGKTGIYELDKSIGGEVIKIANRVHCFFGLYDGRVRPVDREVKGILWYTLCELDTEMKKFPDTFTYDMHFFLKEYRSAMEDFLKVIG